MVVTNPSIHLLPGVALACGPYPSIACHLPSSLQSRPFLPQSFFTVGSGGSRRVHIPGFARRRERVSARNLLFPLCTIAPTRRISPTMVSPHPVLLFDVMGTLVRDPFYEDVPAFFGISMKELLAIKHPTAWVEFEKGVITEEELICNFFKDKREFDSSGLKACMANGYAYLEGIEGLLDRLKSRGYQMHAFSNYSSWYELIEEKLKLSRYLNWSFVSCHTGKRKPDPDAFIEVTKQLGLRPSDVIFIDDQSRNVEAAVQIGMTALNFESAQQLENDLLTLGLAV